MVGWFGVKVAGWFLISACESNCNTVTETPVRDVVDDFFSLRIPVHRRFRIERDDGELAGCIWRSITVMMDGFLSRAVSLQASRSDAGASA
ncbi:MAG: hypothetical protein WEB53_16900 [Akkermansiaceae bacterium]